MTTASRHEAAHGCRSRSARTPSSPFSTQTGLRVDDPIREGRTAEGLRFDEDAAKLALFERALLLHGAEQRLAVQVPVAKVPAEHEPRDHLAVDVLVVLET